MGKERLIWGDIMRIAAIFAVIIIHTAAPILKNFENSPEWRYANLYDSLSRWCIPVFIMLSGAFLTEKISNEPLVIFFKKRFRKVLIPFIIWSAIYYYYSSAAPDFSGLLTHLTLEPAYYHLWFFFLIIGLYIIAPFFSVFILESDKTRIFYFLSVWLIWASLLPYLGILTELKTYYTADLSYKVSGFAGFFAAGYWLKNCKISRKSSLMFLLLFLILSILTSYLTFKRSLQLGGFSDIYYRYTAVNIIALSFSAYIFIKAFSGSAGSSKIIYSLSSATLGIYLVHAIVIDFLRPALLSAVPSNSFIRIPLFSTAVFIISLLIVIILKKIPVIKNAVP